MLITANFQLGSSLLRQFCNPKLLSEIRTRLFPQKVLFSVILEILAGWKEILSKISLMPLLKMLKRIGLKLQPCLSLTFDEKEFVRPFFCKVIYTFYAQY